VIAAMRLFVCGATLLVLAIAGVACKEDGTIKVHHLSFNGVKPWTNGV
jgi:hypothetical protein